MLPLLLGGRSRMLMLIRFGLLGVLLVVTFVFHASGTALVDLRIARLVLLVALVVGFGLITRRRRRDEAEGSSVVGRSDVVPRSGAKLKSVSSTPPSSRHLT